MTTTLTSVPQNPAPARCPEHPAFEADYCPVCGTAQTIAKTVWA